MMTISSVIGLLALSAVPVTGSCLNTVDLDYAVHQGVLNDTYDYFSFKNIRYAEPPVGNLRWKPSLPPQSVDRTINNGTLERHCPQAYPTWLLQSMAAQAGIPLEILMNNFPADPYISEDCLFLDVHVPTDIFRQRGDASSGSAVLVWIHGGGYTIGHKSQSPWSDPSGLLERSRYDNQQGVVLVSINYRLGMFGFLDKQGPDMVGNAGLWDQRLALQWVQKYAHLFGGDPSRVTVMGESAGGGSILHHITAFGGEREVPFASAIVQSPALLMTTNSSAIWETTTAQASNITGKEVVSVDDLRQLNSSALMQVNQASVGSAGYGQFLYGPSVDGELAPDLPGVLLSTGRFHRGVKVMAGHNKNESGMFLPSMSTNDDFMTYLELYPMSDTGRDVVTNELYPNVLDGTYGYTTQFGRANLLYSEMLFTCSTRFLGSAFQNETYNYRFEYGPGIHGQDLAWTFSVEQDPAVDPALAIAMQRYFTNFAMTGNPNGNAAGLETFPQYGDQATLLTFGNTGIGKVDDGASNPRCDYWQSGKFR